MDVIHPLRKWMNSRRPALSQTDAAKRLGVSEGYLSQVLSGKRNVSLKRAAAWSRTTGLPIIAFVVLEAAE